ncbi:NAD(P) transhydrogenase subunit beta [Poriferisphaera corsica]|uniref:NAD(P) transhydrogenase subunit beta n=1 Tax=Poriferisphaera corsica TaxID=2528020 RepID=A0A517YT90_9BACT|nr:NAD(P)(+) transhydrogenase (Re/Si-specific) subunit beta [Poriferisphaera corsica]QDU33460.1 NAD(P) transhydrogenase subunit beta [Poriferisphaera corsica]
MSFFTSPINTLAVLSQNDVVNLIYLAAAVFFIYGLKLLTSVKTARRGNLISAIGMLIAAVVTLFQINNNAGETSFFISFTWIAVALIIGAIVGSTLAIKVPMTGMPQMVALLNGFGGIASLLVACGEYARNYNNNLILDEPWNAILAIGLATLIGGVTFTGSLIAFAKLQGLKIIPDKPVQFIGQKAIIGILLIGSLFLAFYITANHEAWSSLIIIAIASLILGILLVIGIGGADMPVVVSLLNSYSGIAAAMAGFVLNNSALIITGSLVGASGIILTNIMCKAMNRSLLNVLFGGVGGGSSKSSGAGPQGEAREFTPEDAAIVLDAASQVIIVPGYGMAVAQAQHAVKEFTEELAKRNITVKYAIHPVAGRMPGHMNVLLAEAGVPYEQLADLDQINPEFEQTDVALVIGANDVTNPAARHDTGSPIYGMPILDVDKARTVFVIKRSMNPGFAGIQNELYFMENTGMIFGDAKKIIMSLTEELIES